MKDPPVPEEDPEEDPKSLQVASEPENISPTSSAPEITPTIPAMTQQPTDQPMAPTSPAQASGPNATLVSEQSEQDTQKSPQDALETTTNPPTTDNFTAANSTEPKPTKAEQNEDTPAQENEPGPPTEQPQPEASEKPATEKSSTVETTKAKENIEGSSSIKEPVKEEPAPTKASEKPTNPKLDLIPEGDPQDYQAGERFTFLLSDSQSWKTVESPIRNYQLFVVVIIYI